ncbi:MAG: outer membrane lipoprotein carrier protein LolA [Gemmatimonadales bacterium]|nr:outer membrane lipoprotein carrier protein LolA [Gemmatimonadales bacterium]
MKSRHAVLAVLAFLALPVAAHAQNASEIVGRSARVYRSLSSLRADFEQRIDDPMIDTALTSRGTLVQAGQSRLSMKFSSPPSDRIVIDGQYVWVYTPSTTPGQVLRLTLPSGGPVYGFNVLSWILDRPAERYAMKYIRADRLGGRAVDVVELVPNVPELPFRRAVVWLDRDDALPRRLEITERLGGIRTITLARLRVNDDVPDSAFRFDVPSGARVISQ